MPDDLDMELTGYFAAILIGLSLGLIGGGGSILTVPVLVYLFSVDAVLATTYSLFIVGSTALVGTAKAAANKNVDFKMAIIFALPAFVTVVLTRAFLLPAIPNSLFFIGEFEVTKHLGIMVFFAMIMLAAAFNMIRKKSSAAIADDEQSAPNYVRVSILAAIVGVVTGLVGAGGGFLIIPALIFFAKLPIKKAVGTSLLIIAANSTVGFLSDKENFGFIDWPFLIVISIIAIIGIFIGLWLSKSIDGKKLKKGFGWFVFAMALYILSKEILYV